MVGAGQGWWALRVLVARGGVGVFVCVCVCVIYMGVQGIYRARPSRRSFRPGRGTQDGHPRPRGPPALPCSLTPHHPSRCQCGLNVAGEAPLPVPVHPPRGDHIPARSPPTIRNRRLCRRLAHPGWSSWHTSLAHVLGTRPWHTFLAHTFLAHTSLALVLA